MEIIIDFDSDFERIIQRLQNGEDQNSIKKEYSDAHRKMIAEGKLPKYTFMQGLLKLDVTENGPLDFGRVIAMRLLRLPVNDTRKYLLSFSDDDDQQIYIVDDEWEWTGISFDMTKNPRDLRIEIMEFLVMTKVHIDLENVIKRLKNGETGKTIIDEYSRNHHRLNMDPIFYMLDMRIWLDDVNGNLSLSYRDEDYTFLVYHITKRIHHYF